MCGFPILKVKLNSAFGISKLLIVDRYNLCLVK